MTTTPNRIRDIRTAQGKTQEGLARESRVSREYIRRLEEQGHTPGLDVSRRIAEALDVTVDEVFPVGGHTSSAIRLAILCRVAAGPATPTEFTQRQRPLLDDMQREGLIACSQGIWTITDAGHASIVAEAPTSAEAAAVAEGK